MALHDTARLSNLRDSVKAFFVENLARYYDIPVLFDVGLTTPEVQGTQGNTKAQVDKWMTVNFRPIDMSSSSMGELNLEVFCCTRKDSEGFKLMQVVDHVREALSNMDDTIVLYKSSKTVAWVPIGALTLTNFLYGQERRYDDNTKYMALNMKFRWGYKITA